MKKVVSFSGGRTSAKLVLLAMEEFGPSNVDVVFMDTGAEHPMTYKFINELVRVFNVDLTCLRGDFSLPLGKGVGYKVVPLSECKADMKPFKEMMAKYGTPYIGGMFCTDRMKLRPFEKYCKDKYYKNLKQRLEYKEVTGSAWKDNGHETWLGIRADEPKRLSDKKGIRYLAEISDDDKSDIIEWWSEQVFDLEIPEWLGNCVFCPKKSDLKLAAAQRDEPGIYHDWLEAINGSDVRMVESRTISYMKDIGIKERVPFSTYKRSDEFNRYSPFVIHFFLIHKLVKKSN